jgi:hypothetical protein
VCRRAGKAAPGRAKKNQKGPSADAGPKDREADDLSGLLSVQAVRVTAAVPRPKLARIFRLETRDDSSLLNTSHMNFS